MNPALPSSYLGSPSSHLIVYSLRQPINNHRVVPRYQNIKIIAGFCDYFFKPLPMRVRGLVRGGTLLRQGGAGGCENPIIRETGLHCNATLSRRERHTLKGRTRPPVLRVLRSHLVFPPHIAFSINAISKLISLSLFKYCFQASS